MSFVYTVLGDIAKTDNVLNVLCILVIDDPIINGLKLLGILVVDGLSVADEREAVRIVVLDRLYVLSLPQELLVVSVISVAGKVGKICICILGIKLISRDKLGLVNAAVKVSRDLLSASYVGVETELLDKALEVLVLSVLPILTVALGIAERGISTDKELLVERIVAVGNNVFGKSLLKLAVYVAACLTARNVMNYNEVLPCACSEIHVGESVVGGGAARIGIGKAGVTLLINLKHNAGAVVATVVTDDSTADTLGIHCLRVINPSLKGLDTGGDALIDLVLTEVLDLHTAAVVVDELIAVAGIVAQSSLAHLGDIVSGDKTVRAGPLLFSRCIALDLARCTYVIVHCNGIDQALEIVGVAYAVVAAYSEGVSVVGRLGKSETRGVSGSLVHTVNVEADACPTARNGNSVVMYTVKSDVRALGRVEASYPLRAVIIFSADSEQAPLGNLYVNVACRILAIVTHYNAAGVCTGNAAAAGDLKLNSHRCIHLV